MELRYNKSQITNPLVILRKAGYAPFIDPKTGSESFTLRLTANFYPRFHLYLNEKDDDLIFSLHLDQKKPSYGTNHMHSGEYDGPTVEREMTRIKKWIQATISETPKRIATDDQPKKKGLFGGIFG
ncbi:MAG: hypothetical protein ABH826_05590 [Patescibacteria group bacterium]|nr:hypothetical protein [Patescibacteria group bacterium]